jgi:Icc-related predicted phosphoesterase
VKILAISDEVVDFIYSPQIKDKYADVDLVLGCGDLPYYYLEYIVTLLDVPLYYVPGNHDRREQYLSDGRIIHRAEGCEELDQRVVRLPEGKLAERRQAHGATAGGPQLLLAGLGGSLRYNNNVGHQYTESEMFTRALGLAPRLLANRARFGRYLDILVTHAPPRGIHDNSDPAHTGFGTFLRFMDVFKPRLLVHGHSHVYRAATVTNSRYKGTQVINIYPYRLIDWEPETHGRHERAARPG